jgi:hypothetical protein
MANGLIAVGPTDPVHGFPLWYEDSDGTRLELGLDPTDPNLPALELPTPGAPVVFPGNFPDEAFYFMAEAEMLVGGPAGSARARLILALEAAFGGTGAVVDGLQMVFGRVRLRIDDVEPGATYTATGPYGVISGEADDRGRVFETEDIGATGDFTSPFASRIGPFLHWQTNPPAGYVGDGVSERTVQLGTGGAQVFFLLEGPGVGTGPAGGDPTDPGNPNKARTALFTVQGKVATRFGATVTRAVYTPAGGGVDVDVFATSVPGRNLVVTGDGIAATALRDDGGRYVARVSAAARPAQLTVTNTTDVPPFAVTADVTDVVTITDASYDLGAGQLTVAATSSDGRPLTVDGFGAPGTFATAAPPAAVTVTSDLGGAATRAVAVTGAAFPPAPVVANAGADRTVEEGQDVTLDGTGSVAATSFSWQQTAGPAVALDDATGATPTFTAPAAGSVLAFELTVTGPGGPQTDSVTITVVAPPPPVVDTITPARVEFRTQRAQWRIEGTVSAPLPDLVTARLGDAAGPEIGTVAADVTQAFDLRRDLGPADAALRPVPGSLVTLTSTRGATRVVAVTVRN